MPRTDSLSLPDFSRWLGQQRPGREYDFWSGQCAIGQYASARLNEPDFDARSPLDISREKYWELEGNPGFARRHDGVAKTKPWTFGAAYERSLEAIKETADA